MCPALSFHGLKKKIRISPTLSFMLCLIKHHLYVNFIAQFKVFVWCSLMTDCGCWYNQTAEQREEEPYSFFCQNTGLIFLLFSPFVLSSCLFYVHLLTAVCFTISASARLGSPIFSYCLISLLYLWFLPVLLAVVHSIFFLSIFVILMCFDLFFLCPVLLWFPVPL